MSFSSLSIMRLFFAVSLVLAAISLHSQGPAPTTSKPGSKPQQSRQDKTQTGQSPNEQQSSGTVTIDNQVVGPATNEQAHQTEKKSSTDWWLTAFTGALVLVAILQFIAMHKQALYMRKGLHTSLRSARASTRSANAAKEAADATSRNADVTQKTLYLTHRPKIIIRNIVIPELPYLNRQSPLSKLTCELSGYYSVANIGGLPATINRATEGAWCEKELPMERPDRNNPGRQMEVILKPGESKEIDFQKITLPEQDAVSVIRGESSAFFLVQIDYVDEDGTIRRTSACRRFDSGKKAFTRVDNPDYEYAD